MTRKVRIATKARVKVKVKVKVKMTKLYGLQRGKELKVP
jgi:hypothetical protein